MKREREREIDLLQGFGSCDCGGQEVPNLRSINRGPRRVNDAVPVWPGKSQCFNLSLKAGKQRCPSWKAVRQEEFPVTCGSVSLLFYSGLSLIGWGPPLRRVISFTPSTESNVSLGQKHLHTHTQNNVEASIWAPCVPVKSTHNINHKYRVRDRPNGIIKKDLITLIGSSHSVPNKLSGLGQVIQPFRFVTSSVIQGTHTTQ